MELSNIFIKPVSNKIIERINKLRPDTQNVWGKMNAAQMLAHCNVTYGNDLRKHSSQTECLNEIHFKKTIKNKVVGETPYKHNSRTAPQFIIRESKDFESEKQRLINHINKTLHLGENHFDNIESASLEL